MSLTSLCKALGSTPSTKNQDNQNAGCGMPTSQPYKSSKAAWATEQVANQPGLQTKTLSQKQNLEQSPLFN